MKENVRNRCWLVLLMLLMGCAQEREPEDTASPSSEQPLTYATYTNDRFDFSVAYPADLLRPQGEPTNNDGQYFRSPDSQFVMVAYGSHNALGDALEDRYQAILQDTTAASRNVTYNVLRDSFFVISGQEGSHIFYTKTLLHNDVFKVLDLTCDAALQDSLGPIVTHIADSFGND